MTIEISPTTRCYLLSFLFLRAKKHSPYKTIMIFSAQAVTKATQVPRSGALAVAASSVRPACKRARHDFVDDEESSSEPGLVTKLARYHDRSDDESFSIASSDVSMSGDGSSTDGSMSLDNDMDVDVPRVEKRKRAPSSARTGGRKRRGIEATDDPMEVENSQSRELQALTTCALDGPYWTGFEDVSQCVDLSGTEIQYHTRLARRNRSDDYYRRTLDLIFESEEELGDDDQSVMSELTCNSNVYSGADSSNPTFCGLDVRAVDTLAEVLRRVNLSDDRSAAMEIDDDDEPMIFDEYIARSLLSIPQGQRVYFTRSITAAIRQVRRNRRHERIDIWAV